MNKNRGTKIKPSFDIRFLGNWNYKDTGFKPVYTKPIVEMVLESDTFVWEHEEILDLLRAYYDADLAAIEMIKTGESGEIKSFETPFIEKLKSLLLELEEKGEKEEGIPK